MKYIARAVFVALVATIGDYVWFEQGVAHTATNGVLHGAALLFAVGLVLGQREGKLFRGAIGGMLAGVIGAAAFYAASRQLSYLEALIAAWAVMWLVLGAVSAWLRADGLHVWRWLGRGLGAAITSGAAFYFVSGIWTDQPQARNYLWHLAAWTMAWAPGIVALTWGRDDT